MEGAADDAQRTYEWATGKSKSATKQVRGKNDAVHLPGSKAELRRALIEKKRAERSSKAGHFDSMLLFTTLLELLDEDSPTWHSPRLGKPGLKVASKIGKLLQYRCTEHGSGDKKSIVFTRDGEHPYPSPGAIEDARTAADGFMETATGAAAAAVLQGQRDTVRRIREKKARAAGEAPLTKKLRQLYPDDDSSDSEEEGEEAGEGEAGGAGHAGRLRARTVKVVRKPIVFVRATGVDYTGSPDAEAAGQTADAAPASHFAALADSGDDEEDEEEAEDDSSASDGEHEDGEEEDSESSSSKEEEREVGSSAAVSRGAAFTGVSAAGAGKAGGPSRALDAASADESEGSPMAGLGLGLAKLSVQAQEVAEPLVTPTVTAYWEAHTRGVGGKLLARMGYTGGLLGRRTPAGASAAVPAVGAAAEAAGKEQEGEPQAGLGAVGRAVDLPTPIGEDVVFKKDRKGIGHGFR